MRDRDVVIDFLNGGALQRSTSPAARPNSSDFRLSHRRATAVKVMDRHNLTVQEQPGQEDLAEFLKERQVEVVASMPCYLQDNVDKQRGKGVYDGSIRGLQRLNALGYGREGSGLTLNLVYNPLGPSLPPPQLEVEADYKRILGERFGIVFNNLFTLANMPIQRFGAILLSQGQFDSYLDTLQHAHSDANLDGAMCRSLLSVDYRGYVYDCDFNQMLDSRRTRDTCACTSPTPRRGSRQSSRRRPLLRLHRGQGSARRRGGGKWAAAAPQ